MWNKLNFITVESVCSCSDMSDSLRPHELWLARLLHPWDFPGKNTGVGCHFLLQGIFLTQRLNPSLPHCRQTLYSLSHQGIPSQLKAEVSVLSFFCHDHIPPQYSISLFFKLALSFFFFWIVFCFCFMFSILYCFNHLKYIHFIVGILLSYLKFSGV